MAVIFIISMFAACSGATEPADKKFSVVAATFPTYEWLREILGDDADDVELALLLDSGVDLHSYQPSVGDIAAISGCDVFVHVGGESDSWVHDALKTAKNEDMTVINLMKVLAGAVKAEELAEGMEHDEDDEHDHGNERDEEVRGIDEHVWLSLRNAQFVCGYISKELVRLDAKNGAVYAANAEAYITKLSELDTEYQVAVDGAATRTLLFGDRFPFRYLVDDYDIEYYAAFPGCSAETEASFETIVFLAGKTDELELANVMVSESSDKAIARTVIDNTAGRNQNILVLDSMQSVTRKDMAAGVTYISIMESNLEIMKIALD